MQWNFDGSAPIYAQLVEGIRLRIIMGEYLPGSRIPPVRELAMEAGVNPNTMQRALQELERAGLVMSYRTNGRYVTEDAASIEEARTALAQKHVHVFIQRMRELGYDHVGICTMIEKERREDDDADSGVS